MKLARFSRGAELEFWNSVAYYESQAEGLGIEFKLEVEDSIAAIQVCPTLWPKHYGDCRRYVLSRFPFIIYYWDFREYIWLVAIAHISRKLGYWTRRVSEIDKDRE